jgi:hypothetical protein
MTLVYMFVSSVIVVSSVFVGDTVIFPVLVLSSEPIKCSTGLVRAKRYLAEHHAQTQAFDSSATCGA